MFSIHSESLLWDLRSVLAALVDHNNTLDGTTQTYYSQFTVESMIERIENASEACNPQASGPP